MSDNYKVSIITACYNSEKTIERTLKSVLAQTYSNYEYIIIDGMSTDDTLKIIDAYRNAFGSKLKVVSERDSGIYNAMNKGIKMASGELVGIINSDDWYEPDALQTIVYSFKQQRTFCNIFIFFKRLIEPLKSNTRQYYCNALNSKEIAIFIKLRIESNANK